MNTILVKCSTCSTNSGRLLRSLLAVDSSIRNGQFVYANREAKKLLAEISRGDVYVPQEIAAQVASSIKRTILFLKPMVDVYSQNTSTIDLVRRYEKCIQSSKNSVQEPPQAT